PAPLGKPEFLALACRFTRCRFGLGTFPGKPPFFLARGFRLAVFLLAAGHLSFFLLAFQGNETFFLSSLCLRGLTALLGKPAILGLTRRFSLGLGAFPGKTLFLRARSLGLAAFLLAPGRLRFFLLALQCGETFFLRFCGARSLGSGLFLGKPLLFDAPIFSRLEISLPSRRVRVCVAVRSLPTGARAIRQTPRRLGDLRGAVVALLR